MLPPAKVITIYFGTVVRGAPVARGGELVALDWSSKTVRAVVPVAPVHSAPEEDRSPRGNSRGCRGIAVAGGRLVAAHFDHLSFHDFDLRPRGGVSHPLMVGVHEILADERGPIWVTATAIDAAIAFDPASGAIVEQHWPREVPALQRALGLAPAAIDKAADQRRLFVDPPAHLPSHLHLNAVARHRGRTYALLNALGAIVNLSDGSVVVRDDSLKQSHNLLVIDDGIVAVNDTRARAIRFYELATGRLVRRIDLTEYHWVKEREFNPTPDPVLARPMFLRGLDRAGDRIFAGVSPAAILCIDPERGELVDAYSHSLDVRCCVHGLKVVERPDGDRAGQ